jgi:hypothetical protein
VLWSVGLQAEADRVLTREEVVELADAVAGHRGVASGIGSAVYGARLVVEAATREEAISTASALFLTAAMTAGIGSHPVVRAEAVSEDEDEEDW